MVFSIDGREALARLRADRTLRRSVRRIVVAGPTSPGRDRLERIINRTYFACGCRTGTIAVYLSLAFASSLWLAAPGLVRWTWWKVCAVAFLGALVGKLAGIVVSRVRLRRALDDLDSLIP